MPETRARAGSIADALRAIPPCCCCGCDCTCVDCKRLFPVIERLLLISWLFKDFGWMTTNIYLGFPFGMISVSVHLVILLTDPRRSFAFYNASLLFWVTGNFVWMTTEFVFAQPSSVVHLGPKTPLGGLPPSERQQMDNCKEAFFVLGMSIQLIMYLLICMGRVKMPEEEGEDIISKNEVQILLRRSNAAALAESDAMILRGERSVESSSSGITLAFIENAYIIFWISKDLFWAWGTGDLSHGRGLIILFESVALLFGTLSILIYFVTAYIYRRNPVRFIDAITTICWIAANFVWMSGEFFVRYRNLELDDATEDADDSTRVASSCLFCTGILLQILVIAHLTVKKWSAISAAAAAAEAPVGIGIGFGTRGKNLYRHSRIEMFSFGSSHHDGRESFFDGADGGGGGSGKGGLGAKRGSRHGMLSSYSPQNDEDETTVLF